MTLSDLVFCGCGFSRQSWIMINLAKMPPHGELFERREESCCGVETGPIAGCLGTSQGSIQAEWQQCTWLKVTATSGRLGHYFPTQSPRGERAWSDRPQSALHYHLSAAPQVAAGEGKNRLTDDLGEDETETENKGVACLVAYVTVYVRVCQEVASLCFWIHPT